MENEQIVDEHQRRRQELLEGSRHLGGTIAALGWLAAFLGLLITLYVRSELAQAPADPPAHWAALASPLLLAIVGVGVAGLGHLLRALPAICGIPEPTPGPGPRSVNDFIRTMRAHKG
ncbi:hypothetical protein BH24ACT1_BH24ACT1_09230 [soil metagenome]